MVAIMSILSYLFFPSLSLATLQVLAVVEGQYIDIRERTGRVTEAIAALSQGGGGSQEHDQERSHGDWRLSLI